MRNFSFEAGFEYFFFDAKKNPQNSDLDLSLKREIQFQVFVLGPVWVRKIAFSMKPSRTWSSAVSYSVRDVGHVHYRASRP